MPSRIERHKRRAVGYGYSEEHFTETEWLALLAECGGRCLSCGSTENLSADHILPLSLGGANTIENIQPLCCGCNNAKGAAVMDFRAKPRLAVGA